MPIADCKNVGQLDYGLHGFARFNMAPSPAIHLSIFYHAASTILKNLTPLELYTGVTPAIIPLQRFSCLAPVYYANENATFGSDYPELRESFVASLNM